MGTKNNPGEIDCYANAQPDEPMFVLLARDELARDELAPEAVRSWVRLRINKRGALDAKASEALRVADDMEAWARSPKTSTSDINPAPPQPQCLRLTPNEFKMLLETGRSFVTDTSDGEGHYLSINQRPANAWAVQAIEDLRRRGASDVPLRPVPEPFEGKPEGESKAWRDMHDRAALIAFESLMGGAFTRAERIELAFDAADDFMREREKRRAKVTK